MVCQMVLSLSMRAQDTQLNPKTLILHMNSYFKLLDKINEEIHQGKVIVPFVLKPISTLRVSPIGVIPKKNGKYRLIIHLSYPKHMGI